MSTKIPATMLKADFAGIVLPYAGSAAPTGWLLCDGSAVSRTTYADLFSVVSTTFGSGDGSSTFNVPDMRGRVPIGAGTGTLTEDVASGSVNTGADTLTVASNNRKWITGMDVVLTTTGGLPAGLSLATTYYVIRVNATTIKLASSRSNAQNGTAIDLTSQGTGTHTVTHTVETRTRGEKGGEFEHAMSISELLAHTHNAGATNSMTNGATAMRANDAGGNATSSTGGNEAMSLLPPFLGLNYIIKY